MQDLSPNPDYEMRPSGFYKLSDGSGPYSIASDGTATLLGAGGGGTGGGGDASAALQTAGNATLTQISGKLPASLGAKTVAASLSVVPATGSTFNVLAKLGVARQVAAAASGGASASVALTAGCTKVSILATGSALRIAIGTGPQVATATSHRVNENERLDLLVDAGSTVAALSDSATAGTLDISELI